jgi:hypothetical protein
LLNEHSAFLGERGCGILKANDKNKYFTGEIVNLKTTNESVTISKWAYVKNMKKYSYTVKEHPSTFYFEDELQKVSKIL